MRFRAALSTAVASMMLFSAPASGNAADPDASSDDVQDVFSANGEEAKESAEDAPAPASPAGDSGPEGTYVTQPVCGFEGGALCREPDLCEDGTPREVLRFLNTDGEIEWQQDLPCGEDGDPDRDPTPDEVSSEFKKVPLPASTIVVQPPDGETLVNLETIFSTTAQAFDAPLTILDHQVVLHITPTKFTWHHGDDTTQTTTWPGARWTDGANPNELVHHIYKTKATGLQVSVDTTWTATWTLDGRDMGPVPGLVVKTGSTSPLDVLEARPVLTR